MQVLDPLVNSLEVDMSPIPGIPDHEIPKTVWPCGQETIQAGLCVYMQPMGLHPSLGHAALPDPGLESLLAVAVRFGYDVEWFAVFIVIVVVHQCSVLPRGTVVSYLCRGSSCLAVVTKSSGMSIFSSSWRAAVALSMPMSRMAAPTLTSRKPLQ
jgi:hypothetical protein